MFNLCGVLPGYTVYYLGIFPNTKKPLVAKNIQCNGVGDTELSEVLQIPVLMIFIGIIRRAIRLQLSTQIAAVKLPLQIPDVGPL